MPRPLSSVALRLAASKSIVATVSDTPPVPWAASCIAYPTASSLVLAWGIEGDVERGTEVRAV